MILDEAIKIERQRLDELDKRSKLAMYRYQAGFIDKEQHNEKQSKINRKRLAAQLGIEALELYCELRQCTAIDVEDIPIRLPSETEEEK